MSKSTAPILKKLKQYSLLASPVIALSSAASSQVTYKDVNPDLVLKTTGGDFDELPFDLNNDGVVDFVFAVFSKYQTDSSAPKYNKAGIVPYSANGNGVEGYTHDLPPNKFYYASALELNAGISSAKHFWDYFPDFGTFVFYEPGKAFGPWKNVTDHYVGLRFKDTDGNMHYGWMRLDVFEADAEIVIKDYAYADAPNTGIKAGSEVVGVNEVNVENDIKIFSANKNLFIESSILGAEPMKILVRDLAGRMVMNAETSEGHAQLSMKNFSSGLYIVSVTKGNEMKTEKISLQ